MTKKELIKILKKEQETFKNYAGMIIMVEQKRVSEEMGILKFEYYEGNKIEYTGGITVSLGKPVESPPSKNTSPWDKLKPGQSDYIGFYLQARGKSFAEKIGQFIKRSIEESKLQDLIHLIK